MMLSPILTPGQKNYVHKDGTLSETADTPSVFAGTALLFYITCGKIISINHQIYCHNVFGPLFLWYIGILRNLTTT